MANEIRILLVEDDPNLGFILQETLEQEGYLVDLRTDGVEGFSAFVETAYDLCLVDVMMPKKDGFTLVREMKASNEGTPVIFVTAKSLKEDRIAGLKIGADDYVTKPFSMEELVLRIQAVLKRTKSSASNRESVFRIGHFSFDFERRQLSNPDEVRKLTHKEAELLRLFCQHKNIVLEREVALKTIWGDDTFFNARSMDVFISRLRKYLQTDENIEIINVHGRGYKLVVD
jgi:DNA-binding response OmpR family regulator